MGRHMVRIETVEPGATPSSGFCGRPNRRNPPLKKTGLKSGIPPSPHPGPGRPTTFREGARPGRWGGGD